MHHNNIYGEVSESICTSLTDLIDFYTDCLISTVNHVKLVQCKCCTYCCSSDKNEEKCAVNMQQTKSQHVGSRFDILYSTPSSSSSIGLSRVYPTQPKSAPSTRAYGNSIISSRTHKSKKESKKSKKSKKSKSQKGRNSKTKVPSPSTKSNKKGVPEPVPVLVPTPLPSLPSSSFLPSPTCNDLDDCRRPTNPTSKKAQFTPNDTQEVDAPESLAPSASNQQQQPPQPKGLPSNTIDSKPSPAVNTYDNTYSYNDCDDLDNCNRPTNPSSSHQLHPEPSFLSVKSDGGNRKGGLNDHFINCFLIILWFLLFLL